jgi:hypothetical protein
MPGLPQSLNRVQDVEARIQWIACGLRIFPVFLFPIKALLHRILVRSGRFLHFGATRWCTCFTSPLRIIFH